MNESIPSKPLLRTAEIRDADAIVHLLGIMHGESEFRAARSEEVDLLERILLQPLRRLLVAEIDGHVVGTADALVVLNLSRDSSPWATVENLVVHPEFRRRGLAKALMGMVEDYATGFGCYKIQLVSNDARGPAHALYESLKFDANVTGFRKYLTDVDHA